MSHPCWAKPQEGNRLEGTGHFQPKVIPWCLADLRPMLKNYLYGVGLVLKISSRPVNSIITYTFSQGQTDRQTDR